MGKFRHISSESFLIRQPTRSHLDCRLLVAFLVAAGTTLSWVWSK